MRAIVWCVLLGSSTFAAAQSRKDDILVNFAGSIKTITAKDITIEPEEGNDIRFLRTKRTRFLGAAGKPVSDLEFKPGEAVTIEAYQKLNTELEAVNVRHALTPETPPQ